MARATAERTENQIAEATRQITFITVLRNRGFRALWIGQVISQTGDYFGLLAMMIVVSGFSIDVQGTTLSVAGLTIADALPRLLFGALAGVFVDRWDRRRTMIACDLLRGLVMVVMILAFLARSLPGVYILAFLGSSVATLFNPAKSALVPILVPEEQLLSTNSLSQTSMMLSVLAGPALAGLTLKVAGAGNEWAALLVDALSFGVSAVAIWGISVPGRSTAPALARPGVPGGLVSQVWGEMIVGIKMLVLNRTVLTLALIGGMTMLGLGAANVLWLVYLKTRFGFEESELALRLSLLGLALASGMILSSVAIGNFLSRVAPKWLIVAGLLGTGIGLVGFGQLSDYWLLFAATAIIGTFIVPINASVNTLMQTVVPNEQLGRVLGGFSTVTDAATIGSMSLAGVLGATLGIPTVFLLSGIICSIMGVVVWVILPTIDPGSTSS